MPSETTYSRLRENLATVLDQVVEQQETVIVRRRGSGDVALLPASELAGLMETAHLLRSPRKARRLLTAVRRAEQGKGKRMTMDQLRLEIGLRRDARHEAVFQQEFLDDLRYCVKSDRSTALRILDLVEA